MLQKTLGIVLHTLKYKDTSLIVDVYTEVFGRASFLVSVPRSRKAMVKSVLFQPLALVDLEVELRPTSTIYKVREAKSHYPFSSLPYNPYKSAIAMFLSEFLYRAVREEAENRPLFAYLQHSVIWLDECRTGFANFHLVFLMRLSRFLGLYPNLEDYRPGDYFDLRNACFTSLRPQVHSNYIVPAEAARLTRLMRMNYETMHLFAMSREERMRCLIIMNEYYRLHLPDFPVLKSIEVLKELFD
ncbi:DNA repair protein RecO [Bacteroides heparinolyticus]|uniref:DNA repair protein RecO n=1 Tax=Prevotella heparinolytica TaxID=28113 RepID=UPI0023F56602|nr:DNA repair protein RecO [Bacteroides heparinolyticus]MCF0254762.1 DNA repair protein RecO [Bacteroides heparinolyticus]MCI6212470.1 DNA repair protein RecO [Bacteroides heparinolyticus]